MRLWDRVRPIIHHLLKLTFQGLRTEGLNECSQKNGGSDLQKEGGYKL